jgi:transposase
VRSGQLEKALRALAQKLHPSRVAALGGGFSGRQFRQREKGGPAVGPTKRGKGTKIMAIAAVTSIPLAVQVDSASPHESQLLDETLAGSFLDERPARLIGDKAYDSDPLDARLKRDYDIELIAPNRKNRNQTQDRRKLRSYKRRWRVERLFAWLQWFRRLVTRYEYHIENFLGMVRLGCLKIMLRHL